MGGRADCGVVFVIAVPIVFCGWIKESSLLVPLLFAMRYRVQIMAMSHHRREALRVRVGASNPTQPPRPLYKSTIPSLKRPDGNCRRGVNLPAVAGCSALLLGHDGAALMTSPAGAGRSTVRFPRMAVTCEPGTQGEKRKERLPSPPSPAAAANGTASPAPAGRKAGEIALGFGVLTGGQGQGWYPPPSANPHVTARVHHTPSGLAGHSQPAA